MRVWGSVVAVACIHIDLLTFLCHARGADGEEMALLARSELDDNVEKLEALEARLVKALTPRDDADDKGVVLEVRAGTGRKHLGHALCLAGSHPLPLSPSLSLCRRRRGVIIRR